MRFDAHLVLRRPRFPSHGMLYFCLISSWTLYPAFPPARAEEIAAGIFPVARAGMAAAAPVRVPVKYGFQNPGRRVVIYIIVILYYFSTNTKFLFCNLIIDLPQVPHI